MQTWTTKEWGICSFPSWLQALQENLSHGGSFPLSHPQIALQYTEVMIFYFFNTFFLKFTSIRVNGTLQAIEIMLLVQENYN